MQERAMLDHYRKYFVMKETIQFIPASTRMQNNNYTIVIKVDKVPFGEHARRFNAPTINVVSIVMVGDQF